MGKKTSQVVEQCVLDIIVKHGTLDGTFKLPGPAQHRVVSGHLQRNTKIVLVLSQPPYPYPRPPGQHNLKSHTKNYETGSWGCNQEIKFFYALKAFLMKKK